jgi:hypothetical protein
MRSTVSGTSLARNMHPSAVSDHSRYQHEACLPQKQFSPGIWPSSLWWPLFLQLVTARQERGGRGEMCRRSIGFPRAAVSCMAQSRILECRDPVASPLLADAITHGQPATNFLTACLGHVPCFSPVCAVHGGTDYRSCGQPPLERDGIARLGCHDINPIVSIPCDPLLLT